MGAVAKNLKGENRMFTVAGVETHRGVVSTSSHVNMLTCKTQHKSIARKHNTLSPALPNPGRLYAQAELAATVTATARFTRHHALRYRTFLTTPLATVTAVATKSDTALYYGERQILMFLSKKSTKVSTYFKCNMTVNVAVYLENHGQ